MPAKKKKVAAPRESAAKQPEAVPEPNVASPESAELKCQADDIGHHACTCGGDRCGSNVTN